MRNSMLELLSIPMWGGCVLGFITVCFGVSYGLVHLGLWFLYTSVGLFVFSPLEHLFGPLPDVYPENLIPALVIALTITLFLVGGSFLSARMEERNRK